MELLGLARTGYTAAQAPATMDGLVMPDPGGPPVHAILSGERDAILGRFDSWALIDKSHRTFAHRGSRLEVVHVSESTVLRVLRGREPGAGGKPVRSPHVRAHWPEWGAWKPDTICCYDSTRARRVAVAVIDVVHGCMPTQRRSPSRTARSTSRSASMARRSGVNP